jgi:hypothetical protein
MASTAADRAARRAEVKEAAIREHLTESATAAALDEAVDAVRSEAAKVRRHRPADAALIDTQLAAALLATAAKLNDHQPERPDGCGRVPRPDDLLAVFAASYQTALEGGAA